MKCREIEENIISYLEKELPVEQQAAYNEHINSCIACIEVVQETKTILGLLEEYPSQELSTSLDKMLTEFDGVSAENMQKVVSIFNRAFFMKIAAVLVVVLAGYYFLSEFAVPPGIEENNLQMALKGESAGERLAAIYELEDALNEEDEEFIDILLEIVKGDSNQNVKVAAVEALQKFPKNRLVKTTFLEVLKIEKEPILQIKLIKALSMMHEEQLNDVLQDIIENEETIPVVKGNAQLAMNQLKK